LNAVRTLGVPFGGVINFTLKDASPKQIKRFAAALRINALAVSLGGVESLLEVPASMTHSVSTDELRC